MLYVSMQFLSSCCIFLRIGVCGSLLGPGLREVSILTSLIDNTVHLEDISLLKVFVYLIQGSE